MRVGVSRRGQRARELGQSEGRRRQGDDDGDGDGDGGDDDDVSDRREHFGFCRSSLFCVSRPLLTEDVTLGDRNPCKNVQKSIGNYPYPPPSSLLEKEERGVKTDSIGSFFSFRSLFLSIFFLLSFTSSTLHFPFFPPCRFYLLSLLSQDGYRGQGLSPSYVSEKAKAIKEERRKTKHLFSYPLTTTM